MWVLWRRGGHQASGAPPARPPSPHHRPLTIPVGPSCEQAAGRRAQRAEVSTLSQTAGATLLDAHKTHPLRFPIVRPELGKHMTSEFLEAQGNLIFNMISIPGTLIKELPHCGVGDTRFLICGALQSGILLFSFFLPLLLHPIGCKKSIFYI